MNEYEEKMTDASGEESASFQNPPPDFRPDPHVMDYVLLLAKHKWLVILVTFLSGAIALGFTYIVPNSYDAESVLLPPDRMSSAGLLSALNAGGALKILKEVDNPSVDLIQNLLESDSLAERLLGDSSIRRHFGSGATVREEEIANLKKAFVITPWFSKITVKGSAATGWFPDDREKEDARKLAAYLTNKSISTMDTMLLEYFQEGTHLSRIYADSDYATRNRELDSLDGVQEQFEKDNGIPSLKEQTVQIMTEVGQLEADRDEATIRANLLRMDYSAGDPEMKAAQAEVEETQDALTQYERENPIGPSLEELPAVTRKYMEIVRQKAVLEPIVFFLRQEREQERITEERQKSLLTILDVAKEPESRSSPKRLPLLMLGLSGGVFISIIWIGLISLLSSWKRMSRMAEYSKSTTTYS